MLAGHWVVNRAAPRAAENQRSKDSWAKNTLSFQPLKKNARTFSLWSWMSGVATSGAGCQELQPLETDARTFNLWSWTFSWELKRGVWRVWQLCCIIQPDIIHLYSFIYCLSRDLHSHKSICKPIFISPHIIIIRSHSLWPVTKIWMPPGTKRWVI